MEKIELDFSYPITYVNGEEVKKLNSEDPEIAGELLANELANSPEGDDPGKIYFWCTELYAKKPLQVSKKEEEFLKGFITKARMKNFVKANLLKAFK
jgi:hypothetical protein